MVWDLWLKTMYFVRCGRGALRTYVSLGNQGIHKLLETTHAVQLLTLDLPSQIRRSGPVGISDNKVVSTDPPYYDNIGYADLSDFFYVWLRQSLRQVFPDLFATLSTPKAEELVAYSLSAWN